MSGFSADWLALREPADHRARNAGLLAQVGTYFAKRAAVEVVDLGCGAGSNLRALAPVLPAEQRWRLVDYDPALLTAARERLIAWADRSAPEGDALRLEKHGRTFHVRFVQADLAADLEAVLDSPADLVTAAALFDLVSAAWIARFAQAVARRRGAFYTALTYNGQESWEPPHPADADMLSAFHAHQGGDKGFGPSAGPRASAELANSFGAEGYRVSEGDSPWRLGPTEARLISELAGGVAQAVRDTGRVPEEAVSVWLQNRSAAQGCTVGHTDLLALPGPAGL